MKKIAPTGGIPEKCKSTTFYRIEVLINKELTNVLHSQDKG